jgi:hypothetical protein
MSVIAWSVRGRLNSRVTVAAARLRASSLEADLSSGRFGVGVDGFMAATDLT